MFNKIGVIGAGNVGTSIVRILAMQSLSKDISLVDINAGLASGNATDLMHMRPIAKFSTKIQGGSDFSSITNAELVIITAGFPRQKGMSRSDVLLSNLPIINDIANKVSLYAPDAIVILATNPVDSLTYLLWQLLGWDRYRIIGLGGELDRARMASLVIENRLIQSRDVNCMVIGGHGDYMVPLIEYSTVDNKPLQQLIELEELEDIRHNTINAGADIIEKRGVSAYEAPGYAVANMVSGMLREEKDLYSCVTILDGEYGEQDVAMSVPVYLSQRGIEEIKVLEIKDQDKETLSMSADNVRADICYGLESSLFCSTNQQSKIP